MITNISELIEYLKKDSEDYESTIRKDRFLFKQPGCTPENLVKLEGILGTLPKSYRNFVSLYDFNKVSVGYFGLSPISFETENIVEALVKANTEESFLPLEFLKKNGLIWIGSNNDYTVYVATNKSHFKEGEIILVDEEILVNIDNPRDCDIQKLAKNFEQFLVAAGNLNQIHREINDDNSNWEEKKSEFVQRLKILGVDEIYHKAWLLVF